MPGPIIDQSYALPPIITAIGTLADFASALAFGLAHNPGTSLQSRHIAEALGSVGEALYGLKKGLEEGSSNESDIAITRGLAAVVYGVGGSFIGASYGVKAAAVAGFMAVGFGIAVPPAVARGIAYDLSGSFLQSGEWWILGRAPSIATEPADADVHGRLHHRARPTRRERAA
jgi:hypothetical protein